MAPKWEVAMGAWTWAVVPPAPHPAPLLPLQATPPPATGTCRHPSRISAASPPWASTTRPPASRPGLSHPCRPAGIPGPGCAIVLGCEAAAILPPSRHVTPPPLQEKRSFLDLGPTVQRSLSVCACIRCHSHNACTRGCARAAVPLRGFFFSLGSSGGVLNQTLRWSDHRDGQRKHRGRPPP